MFVKLKLYWKLILLFPIFMSLVQCTMGNIEPFQSPIQTKVPVSHQPTRAHISHSIATNFQKNSLKTEESSMLTSESVHPQISHDFSLQTVAKIESNPIAENNLLISQNLEPCTSPPLESTIEVDISEQRLYLICHYGNHQEQKIYLVSTSKYGIGNQAGSGKTPLGQHYIKQKIGEGAPIGTIFKARRNTGRIAKMNASGVGDLVTTRIMWLKGLEPGKNLGKGIDSYKRYIYIHGTAEENKIGQPASHGCVRMYNHDVIDLFDRVSEGTKVYLKK
jgi:lipoprotein-anchoring transpeptidase ErfK/SrfK